ncbi:unnamed protein product, partial [Amoebophrya sp. A120]|eukprot:GSA120T00024195001.1
MDFPDLQREWRLHERARRRFFNLRRFLVNYAMEGLNSGDRSGFLEHQNESHTDSSPDHGKQQGAPTGAPSGNNSPENSNSRRRTTVKRRSFSVMEDVAKQEENLLSTEERKMIIIRAVEQGKVNKIRTYLQSPNVNNDTKLWNQVNSRGDTPLLVAAKDRETAMMHLLCSNWPTVNLDIQDKAAGMTCLHYLTLLNITDDII